MNWFPSLTHLDRVWGPISPPNFPTVGPLMVKGFVSDNIVWPLKDLSFTNDFHNVTLILGFPRDKLLNFTCFYPSSQLELLIKLTESGWANPVSFATTKGITVVFFSSSY